MFCRVEVHLIDGALRVKTIARKEPCIYITACWVIFHAFSSSADFFKVNFFKEKFQKYHKGVKQFGS